MNTLTKIVAAGGAILIIDIVASKILAEREALEKWFEAERYSTSVNKPLLNVGCGNNPRFIGDINIDVRESILPNYQTVDVELPLPYADKTFGACAAFNIIEHVTNPREVLQELERVADRVYIVVPEIFSLIDYVGFGHKWMFGSAEAYDLAPIQGAFRATIYGLLGAGMLWYSLR